MPFDSLNSDVRQLIFDLLPRRDIKSLRLVNKAIHAQARLSIKRLFLSPNRTNIDVFDAVLDHEAFREQVQEIVWDDARLQYYQDYERSPLEIEFTNHDSPPNDFTTYVSDVEDQEFIDQTVPDLRRKELWGDAEELSMRDSFRIYRALYDEQQTIIQRQEDVEMLRRGLLELPSLKRVTLTSEAWRLYPLFPVYETPFFRMLKPGMKMPLPWPWLGEVDIPLARLEERSEILETPWDLSCENWRGYGIVVGELLTTAPHHKVKEFVVDVHREKTGILQQLFLAQNAGLSTTEEMFKTLDLTRLDLALNMEQLSQSWGEGLDSSCFWNKPWMKRALSNLKNLEHFHLHLSSVEDYIRFERPDAVPWMDLQRILPTPHKEAWPHLQYLGLANVMTTEDSLYMLLSSLPALKHIDLDSIVLRTTQAKVAFTLESLLDRIKASLTDAYPEDESWKNRTIAPRWTIRDLLGDRITRLTYYNDVIHDYLYGDSGNPLSPGNYRGAWNTEDFDEGVKVLHRSKLANAAEHEKRMLRSLLLYPPP